MTLRAELWAKQNDLSEPYPLACHLLDTATAGLVLWDRWLRPGLRELVARDLGADARAWAGFACGCHDVGKANPVFEGQLSANPVKPWMVEVRRQLTESGYDLSAGRGGDEVLRRHEKTSALTFFGSNDWNNEAAADCWLGLVALGHHGSFGPVDPLGARPFARYGQGEWAQARSELASLVRSAVKLPVVAGMPAASPTVTVVLSGFTVLADRTASALEAVKQGQDEMARGLISTDDPVGWVQHRYTWFETAIEQNLGIYHDFTDARTSILGPKNTPRPLQKLASQTGRGLWVAMAPTGSGKTEAALLRHATQPERLIFLLPTMATSNAMMRRIQWAFRDTSNAAALLHSLASLEDFYTHPIGENDEHDSGGLFPTDYVRTQSARLLAPVSVGTVDQALRAALPLKWTHLRLLALANAHVVIDEVHTMDHYQTELLRTLMVWWGLTDTRVTLLTATLPTWQRDALAHDYDKGAALATPHFPSAQVIGRPAVDIPAKPYRIDLTTTVTADPATAHAEWLTNMRSQYPNARLGVICNTVAEAQAVAQRVSARGEKPLVLHSRMTAQHRQNVAGQLEALLGPYGDGRGVSVVGTQTIEASLDIDLDILSTDLAPAPSLIQRAGRAWRRDDARRISRIGGVPALPLRIVRGSQNGWYLPYFETELERTWSFITRRDHLLCPADMQDFVESATLSLDDPKVATALDELAAKAAGGQAGKVRSEGIRDALRSDATVMDFARLTQWAQAAVEDLDDAVTRLIEPPTVHVLLLGDSAVVPGAWGEGIPALERIRGFDQERQRRAMQASLTLNGRFARAVLKNHDEFAPVAPLLKGLIPMEVGRCFGYDPLLGVTERAE